MALKTQPNLTFFISYYKDFLAKYQSTISKSLFFLSANASIVLGAGTITLSPGSQSKGHATLFADAAIVADSTVPLTLAPDTE